MMTYLLLNIVFVLAVCVVFGIRLQRPTKRGGIAIAVLFLLTIVFDSLIVHFHIVDYATNHLLGIYIGFAPLEDYFYPLLALIVIPFLWRRFGKDV